MKLKDNPVRTSGGATGIISTFLASLGIWGLSALAVPPAVMTSGIAVVVLAAAVIGGVIGNWVQKHYTEPKGVIDEIVANMQGEESNATVYAKARAHNDTDHLPKGMEG